MSRMIKKKIDANRFINRIQKHHANAGLFCFFSLLVCLLVCLFKCGYQSKICWKFNWEKNWFVIYFICTAKRKKYETRFSRCLISDRNWNQSSRIACPNKYRIIRKCCRFEKKRLSTPTATGPNWNKTNSTLILIQHNTLSLFQLYLSSINCKNL